MVWLCYLIKSLDSNKTYIGCTNNLLRRLDDHNNINKGRGAKYTRGERWVPACYVTGFQTHSQCLSFEWKFKNMRKHRTKSNKKIKQLSLSDIPYKYGKNTLHDRVLDLYSLVHLEKWTSKCPNASTIPLIINWIDPNLQYDIQLPDYVDEITDFGEHIQPF
jgi:predicted GIY-YIG superfamily endonuclease